MIQLSDSQIVPAVIPENITKYNTIIDKIQKEDIINKYHDRKIIKKLLIDYEEILNSINVYKANR